MVMKKLLLSIDGGGIRGIIPVCMLIELERVTGKLARETFAFVGGTSTGAVITSGIAAGIPASLMLNLYLKRSKEVFSRPPWPFYLIQRFLRGHMYSSSTLRRVLA